MATATAITTSTATRTEMSLPAASLLHLMWLASPALPVGGFSYSEVLEAGIDRSFVATESEASQWLSDQLHLTLARSDLAVVARAVQAWRNADLPRIVALNDWVLHSRESSELRLQSEQMGRSFIEWLRSVQPALVQAPALAATLGTPTYPIAFALAAAQVEASVQDCCLSYAFGWAENMAQAAVRAVPLGQSAGQRIVQRLAAEIPAAVDHAMAMADNERQAFSPMLAILSAQHETQYSRLFRS